MNQMKRRAKQNSPWIRNPKIPQFGLPHRGSRAVKKTYAKYVFIYMNHISYLENFFNFVHLQRHTMLTSIFTHWQRQHATGL